MFSSPANCLRPKTKVSADGSVQDYDAGDNGNPNLTLQNVPSSQLPSTSVECSCHLAISTAGLSFAEGAEKNNTTVSPPGQESR